jgi:hypothetical protein
MWILSSILCFGLILAMLGVMFPEAVLPMLRRLWEKHDYYWK